MISRRLVLIFFVEQTNSRLSLQANDRKPVNVSRISSSVTRVNQLCRVGLSFLARLSADWTQHTRHNKDGRQQSKQRGNTTTHTHVDNTQKKIQSLDPMARHYHDDHQPGDAAELFSPYTGRHLFFSFSKGFFPFLSIRLADSFWVITKKSESQSLVDLFESNQAIADCRSDFSDELDTHSKGFEQLLTNERAHVANQFSY